MTDGMWAQSPQWRMDSFTVDAALPVATEPVYGIPGPSLQPMQLLSALSKDAGPTQVASVRWQNQPGTAVALSALGLSAPGEDTGEARVVGYIPTSTPEATVDWAKARLGYAWWLVLCVVLQVINPFLVLPLLYMVDEQAAWQVFGAYFFVWLYSLFTVPFIWLGLMIYSLVKLPQKRREAVARATTYGAFWYHPVYDHALQEGAHPDEAGGARGIVSASGVASHKCPPVDPW